MAVYPFSPSGLANKVAELYALTDTALYAEADAVADDLTAWLALNFTFDTYQQNYLDMMPSHVRKLWGCMFAGCLIMRGNIDMGGFPANPAPRRTKELRENVTAAVAYDDASQQVSGTFAVDIAWMLL